MPNHFTILYRAQEITNFEMEYIVDQSEERISKVQVVMKLRNVLAVFNYMISNEGKEIIVFNSTWIMRMYLLWDETKKKNLLFAKKYIQISPGKQNLHYIDYHRTARKYLN